MPYLKPGLWLVIIMSLLVPAQSFAGIPERSLENYCGKSSECRVLNLDGPWAFQKGLLLGSQQLADSGTLNVPGAWNPTPLNPWSQLWQEARGVGTYGLVLRGLPSIPGLTLQLNSVHGAYRVFWRPLTEGTADRLIFELGWNEQAPLNGSVVLRNDLIALPLLNSAADYVLVIQVANTALAKGGLRVTPRLGLAQDFHGAQLRETLELCLLIGAMLIIAFYHLLIFQQRRSDLSALWLAIQCFSVAAHTAGLRGMAALIWSEPSDFMTLVRTWMIYQTHFIGPLAFYGFIAVHFPLVRHHSARLFFGLPSAAIALLLFTPLFFVSRLYTLVFLPVLTIFILYIFWRCVVTVRQDRSFRWILGGIFVLGLAGIHDALAGSRFVVDSGLVPWAEVAFIMMQGGMISKRFALAYREAARSSQELEQEVKRQTRDIHSILDTIQQGILTIRGMDLKLGDDYSRYLERHFHESIVTRDFNQVLDQAIGLTGDVRDQIKQTLCACLGEEILAFELNQALLPTELVFRIDDQNRVFEIDWSPVLDGRGVIEKILVCLRDVTEIRRLRDQTQQNEEDMSILSELLNIPEDRFRSFVKRMNLHLGDSQMLVRSLENNRQVDRKEAIRQIFMNVHTVKGSARTLQLKAIAAASHELEQEISSMQAMPDERNLSVFHDKFARVVGVVERYQEMSQQKLGWDFDEDRLRLPRSLILLNLQFLANLPLTRMKPEEVQAVLHLERTFQRYCSAGLAHAIQEASRGLDSIARDLNKEPPKVEVEAQGIMLTESGQQLVQTLFTHILRNAVDHGLEDRNERQEQDKDRQGSIHIEAQVEGPWLRILCFDDGRGLNLEKIKARAIEKGLIPPSWEGSDQAIAALIFKAGLSTKDAVTEISGRGVGMDAVQSFIERVGGKLAIELRSSSASKPFAGFALIIQLPATIWWVGRSPEPLQVGA